jgi:hypothetical protein
MSANGWRPEDDADLPEGWTWKRSCQNCHGAMPIRGIDDFCSDGCLDQHEADMEAEDEDESE